MAARHDVWCPSYRGEPCDCDPAPAAETSPPERYGPAGEVLRQSDRDHIRRDFDRRIREGRGGMVEAAALVCWFGAERELAESRAALAALRERVEALAERCDQDAATWDDLSGKAVSNALAFERNAKAVLCREHAAALRAALSGEGP